MMIDLNKQKYHTEMFEAFVKLDSNGLLTKVEKKNIEKRIDKIMFKD